MPEDDRSPRNTVATISLEHTLTPTEALGMDATEAPSVPGPASTGALPSRYQLGARIGAGGMGEVLLASDQQIGREVAIKRMLVASSAGESRFLREAKIQGRLDHPAIVPVHELSTDSQGRPFFVMKRLTGTTLADVLARKATKFTRQRLLRAFADVCLAIEFAHSKGIVHRDLKPANIMLGDFGEVYVLDWGIARILDEKEDDLDAQSLEHSSRSDATEIGTVLGTPGYMAPEQMRGLAVDGRADVFALGCILFEILAGQPLLPRGRDMLETAFIDLDTRPSSRAPDRDIPPELDTLCVDVTQLEADRRPQTAREVGERIERFIDGDRDVARRKDLASAHLSSARTALASGDGEGQRATAMREAGRAIALDPTASDAAELVGRLMLEPPRTVPAEVERRLAEIEDQTARRRSKLIAVIALGFIGFLPILAWMGITDPSAIVAFGIAVMLNGAYALMISRRGKTASIVELHIAVVFNAVVIAIIARIFTPFLVAPGIAATGTMMFLADQRMRPKFVVLVTVGAVLVPLGLELAGLLTPTVGERSGDLVLHSPAVTVEMPTTALALALYVATLIALSAIVAKQLGETVRSSLRAVELQAWHLRQLVHS